jgi:hypothetical protein
MWPTNLYAKKSEFHQTICSTSLSAAASPDKRNNYSLSVAANVETTYQKTDS